MWSTWLPFSNTGRIYAPRLVCPTGAAPVSERRCFAWSQCYGASLFDVHLEPDFTATYFPAYSPPWSYDPDTNNIHIEADESYDEAATVWYDFVCLPGSWSARVLSANPWRTAAYSIGWHPHNAADIGAPSYWQHAFLPGEPIEFRIYPLLPDARRINDPQQFQFMR